MKRFRSVVLGLDLAGQQRLVSQNQPRGSGSRALAEAAWLCEQTAAPLRIVTVLPIDVRSQRLLRQHGPVSKPSPIDAAHARLLEIARPLEDRGIRVSCVVRIGAPVAELLEEARLVQADVIVVAGSDSERPWGLLGSTAAQLFRTADVPVWIARRGAPDRARCVLAAVALDEHSHGVLRLAADTARRTGAELHVLHVAVDGARVPLALAHESLRAWTEVHAPGVRIGSIEVLAGEPVDVLVSRAAAHAADALFVGPARRDALTTWLVGGATDRLLANASCSLVCARSVESDVRWPEPGELPPTPQEQGVAGVLD